MKIWGLTLFFLTWGLSAMAQQSQTPAPALPTDNRSPAAVSGQQVEESPTLAASDESKSGESPKLDLTPDAKGKLSQEQIEPLVRVVADRFIENEKRKRDYTYIERDVTNTLDGKGQTKSTEVRTYEIVQIYGEQVYRLIEKDDKPLDAKDAAKEEEKIQKFMDKHRNESEEDRKKREEKEEKNREEGLKFFREVANAYNFNLVGTELVDGREAWVIDGEPRPRFEPHVKGAKILADFHGRVWIDKSELQCSKIDLAAIDTASIGWVLARIHKGTQVMFERTRVNDEVWLPLHTTFKLDARVALLKGYRLDGDKTFRDYKKFRTSARIVRVGEAPEAK
jgi:hypothetical protein